MFKFSKAYQKIWRVKHGQMTLKLPQWGIDLPHKIHS